TASVSGGVTVNSVTFTDAKHVTLNISTAGAGVGAQDVTVTNPDGQSRTGTGILTVTAPTVGLCTQPGLSNPCVPGGTRDSTQCFFEWAPNPVPPRMHDLTPRNTLICYEGDPACDLDGSNNNHCTIQTRLCINNADPRMPSCLPHEVDKFEVLAP